MTRALPLLAAAALPLMMLGTLPLLAGALVRLAALLRYPYPHDGLEGTLLHEARLLWSGQPLYQPLERFRFVSAPYPPLHPLLLGLADQIAGPHVFWGGRLISLAAALAVAGLVALIVRRACGFWLAGAVGAALFLGAPPVLLWATRIKPDLLALFFTALGLFLATRLIGEGRGARGEGRGEAERSITRSPVHPLTRSPRLVWWPVVALCFALAFFTKQTAVAAPLAVGLALLVADARGGWGGPARWLPLRAAVFGLAYLGMIGVTWLLLDYVTAGQFTAHVWGLHRSEWWSAGLLRKFVALLAGWWPAALLALLALRRAWGDNRLLAPACYALVAPISLLGAGETGANHNHLLEMTLALAIATGIGAGWAAVLLARRQPAALLVAALAAAQIASAYAPPQWYRGELYPDDPPERYLAFIRATPGEILADDVALLLQAGRPLRYDDPSTMGPAARSGVWDQSGLIEEIAARRFSAIMIPVDLRRDTTHAGGRWTPEVLAAIRAHYRLAFRDRIFTYVPK